MRHSGALVTMEARSLLLSFVRTKNRKPSSNLLQHKKQSALACSHARETHTHPCSSLSFHSAALNAAVAGGRAGEQLHEALSVRVCACIKMKY